MYDCLFTADFKVFYFYYLLAEIKCIIQYIFVSNELVDMIINAGQFS